MKRNGGLVLVAILLACLAGSLNAQSFGDQIVIRPGAPSTLDSIQVDVPVRACLRGDPLRLITTTSTHITGHVIALAVDQTGLAGCGDGDGMTTKAFTFFIQPLSQQSYTINFTRTIGASVDLQRSSMVVVSAPFGAATPTLTRVTVLLLPLLLLAALALVIAAPRPTVGRG